MRERPPFFREEDECNWAVVVEDTVEADLNRKYQKPYSIFTQKRIYILLIIRRLLAVILFILGIKQNKSNTAFFITHSTERFSFTPGLYPASEWKPFAAQVKALKAGDANVQ